MEDIISNGDFCYGQIENEPKKSFTSMMELQGNKDDDNISLLEDFGEDDSLEDPF